MRNLIEDVSGIVGEGQVSYRDAHKIVLVDGNLELTVYDKENLVGFTLSGDIHGNKIYVVHDTDNYDKSNPKYQHLFSDAVTDTKHIVRMFIGHKIRTKVVTRKGLIRMKSYSQVIIPNKSGEDVAYNGLTVNTTTFYEG